MSTDAYLRVANRERIIWPQFLYGAVFIADRSVERTVVFGLYAGAYNNRNNYLLDFETFELQRLLDDYNTKMAGLSTDEQILVNQIATKRYLADLEKAMHDDKMTTLENKINKDDDEMDAKFDALDADRAELETLSARVTMETNVTEAKIHTLEAQIKEEEVNYAFADAEVHRKEIQVEETNLKTLQVMNDILRIQIAINATALELVEVDQRKAEIQLRTENAASDVRNTGILENDLAITTGHKSMEDNALESDTVELSTLDTKKSEVGAEISHADNTVDFENSDAANKLDLLAARHDNQMKALDRRADANSVEISYRDQNGELLVYAANADKDVRLVTDEGHDQVTLAQNTAAYNNYLAAVEAATTLAKSKVVSTLTHSIGKVSGS